MRPLNFISAPQKAKHYFYWSILTADDSIKCRSANSSMTGQVGGFQNPGVFWSARDSFLSSPPPPRSLTCAIFCAVFNLLLFLILCSQTTWKRLLQRLSRVPRNQILIRQGKLLI